ncbi:2-phospho-L-lactate transferase [Sandaracinobacter sp. RS1-74]|uniref:2-phospho-L-lactate transferase n=1 Tax=Sandaracinobacteroides sayramensis TaxID=2913411 RepID=UPI001EDA9123|nr:2-phospho-L-lactate transferase [Sandaracinobacteroides sayramensis]MCG2841097.1 2-phospho-L-lactate transferase [Sandaracinobacteroides sayramensis]
MKSVVLTGGVGGAKLVLGLIHALPAADVTAIVNSADDFRHFGLAISPDIDTLLYTLSGKANAAQGWGREGESWAFMEALRSLGGEDWFALGDGDLALHVLRTARLAAGESLSAITADFARKWGIGARILPMSDDIVATQLVTDEGRLDFQRYFVERRCQPVVRSVEFAGAATARPAPCVVEALLSPETDAILIAPSNPFLSVDPLLAIPAIREALRQASAPIVAVSPIPGGQAVKGPTAKLMRELGLEVNAAAIARHYQGIADALLLDDRDPPADIHMPYARTDTLMQTLDDRVRVARAALALAASVAP